MGLQGTIKTYKVSRVNSYACYANLPMNKLLKKLTEWLSASKAAPLHSALPGSRNPPPSLQHGGSETATRTLLVQILLRDLLRKSGMPAGLVQCQMQVMYSRTRGQRLYVRLVVRHWDERLMKYAFVFQKALLTEILQFEPQAASWLQGITWQLEVASSCPLTELPGPEFWQAAQASVEADEPVDPFDITPLPADAVAASPEPRPVPVAAAPVAVPTWPELSAAAAPAAAPLLDPVQPLPSLIDEPATAQDDTAQDLERLFAIRDNELALNNMLLAGYESTEPSPLEKR